MGVAMDRAAERIRLALESADAASEMAGDTTTN
jgi:hypothetical protein